MDPVALNALASRLGRDATGTEEWIRSIAENGLHQGLWWVIEGEIETRIRDCRDRFALAPAEQLPEQRAAFVTLINLLTDLRSLLGTPDESRPAVDAMTDDLINIERKDHATR